MSQEPTSQAVAVMAAGEAFIRAAHEAMPTVHPMFAAQVALRALAVGVKDDEGRVLNVPSMPGDGPAGASHGLTPAPVGLGTSVPARGRRMGRRFGAAERVAM